MVKLTGCLLIITAFSSFGIIRTRLSKRRCNTLEILIRCVKRMGAEASFSGKRAELILTEAALEYKLPVLRQASGLLSSLGTKSALSTAFTANKEKLSLTSSDIRYASSIHSIFDYSGKEQQENISMVIKLLELSYNDAKNSYEKNARLYKSGGVLCGLLTAILLL